MLNNIMPFWLLVLVILFGLFYQIFRVRIKGKVGEKKVALMLAMLNSEKYKVLNDVVLDIGGRTSQIDHIVISDYGVFVIETKNYSGWIFGGENSVYWTQVIFKWKEKFYNPIRQNLAHILALKAVLKQFPGLKYTSVIVFSSKATLKVSTETAVIHPLQVLGYIKDHSEINLASGEKEKIYAVLDLLNSAKTFDKDLHIETIRNSIRNKGESISQGRCPRCGSRLVERNGRYGVFIGCDGYPNCNFTRQA